MSDDGALMSLEDDKPFSNQTRMKDSGHWLYLVLISSSQLILLMVAVLILFDWQKKFADRLLDQQACLDNHQIIQALAEEIDVENIIDIRAERSQDRGRLEALIRRSRIPAGHRVAIFDFATGEPLHHFGGPSPLDSHPLLVSQTMSVTDGNPVGPIRQALSNQNRRLSGLQTLENQKLLVSARYLPRLNAILVIGQSPSLAANGLGKLITETHSAANSMVLVIGLIGLCTTFIVVQRVSQAVISINDGLAKVVSTSSSELIKTKNAVIFGLAKLAESRDNDTGEHLERIRIYVTILAKELAQTRPEFDDQFIHDIGLASSLHDIGKVGIPDSILLKPGMLTPEERGIMEIHTLIGGECLDAIQARLGNNEFMSIARQIAYYHHEKWDGTGYPHSLKSEEIPLSARIVAVADVYDALTSKRPYKRAMTHEESKAIIVKGTGKHFDPEIVQAFLKHEDAFEAVSVQQQSLTDEQATSNFQRLCEAARPENQPEMVGV